MTGALLAVAAAVCWSVSAIMVRLGLRGGIKSTTGTFISTISSLILLGGLALLIDFKDIRLLSLTTVAWFAAVGLVNYVGGRLFNYISIRRIGVAKAAPLFASSPLFAFIFAVTFLGETVNLALIIGTLTIAAGLYLVVTSQ